MFQKVRKREKITQKQIAEALGVDRSTVAKWETGKAAPRAALLPKLAKILNCSIEELLTKE